MTGFGSENLSQTVRGFEMAFDLSRESVKVTAFEWAIE